MTNNIFPEIICRNGRWFLRYIYDGETVKVVKEIDLPNHPMMNRIWEASSNLLDVYIDDCGGNLSRCVNVLREASKNFAGISELLADKANSLEMDILYAPDDDEPYWNK